MSASSKPSVLPAALSVAAIAIAVAALLRAPEASAPLTADDGASRAELEELTARIARLERAPAPAAGPSPAAAAPREADPNGTRPQSPRRDAVDVATQQRIAELTTRIHNLEAAQQREDDRKQSLAAPDSIPAALAVLLASRGVVTKVGDIEAIQQNLDVLASIAGDASCGEWDRIEAFRGMLMFGFAEPEKCAAAMPGVAGILLTSKDSKARRSAAAMLGNYDNPAITNTVLAAFGREPDREVRAALLPVLLKLRSDPTVLQLLRQAAKNDPDEDLRARIAKALG